MDIHLGTHLDAPSHFVTGGMTVDKVSLAQTTGSCTVIEFSSSEVREIPASVMDGVLAERVLFKTSNSSLLSRREFEPDFVSLSEELALVLVQRDIKLVGIDYFSVDQFRSEGSPVHRILLDAGVLILEGVNLSGIQPGDYQLLALPLNIVGAEGSPLRAVLAK